MNRKTGTFVLNQTDCTMNHISYENQIGRLNRLISEMNNIAQLPEEQLRRRPAKGAWSILEVVEHMNKAYDPHYRNHLEKALHQALEQEAAPTEFRGGRIARFFYNGIRPQDGRRKMKMKTLKKFQPETVDQLTAKTVFTVFFELQDHLKAQIIKARNSNISGKKIPSAIGSLIQFTIPECFEFVISHEERHLLQCAEILA